MAEDFLQALSFEQQRLLEVSQEQSSLWSRHLQETFERLSAAKLPRPQEELINGQGATKLSGLLRPHQPSLLAESVDPCPEPAVLLEELPVVSAPPSREISRHPTNISSNSRKTSKNIRSEHTQILKTQTSLTARSHSLREKAAAYVDYLAAFLVLLNSAVMMLELELEGRAIGRNLALSEGPQLQDIEGLFKTLHHTFVFVFLAELLIRNWFDVVLVLAGLLEVFFIGGDPKNILMMRLMRTLKAFRAVRMVRTFRLFKGLQLLVKACTCFLPSLGWSMVLLVVFMSIGTLVLGNLLQDFITNESNNLEDRHWIWNRYGTAYRAMYTLYEVTFAGNWPTNARPVLEKVSQGFVVFFVLYVTIIVFAIIRVISAIFLKDTLDAAQADAESVVVDRLRKKAEYLQKLESLFRAMDEEGDGMISEQKLLSIFANPKVEAYFQTLDVDVTEGAALFNMIDNGDGQVTLDEFVDGILRCRGPARALDQVAMRADLKNLDSKLNALLQVAGVGKEKKQLKV